MDIHEYQAKQLLRHYGVPVTDFSVVSSLEDLQRIMEHLNLEQAIIKVQVHAGGRGKAGGVKVARTRAEIVSFVEKMLGMKIVNNQTGPLGVVAHQLMITSIVDIKREMYMGAVIDRKRAQALLIVSPEGGMDIEEIAKKSPEKILTVPIANDGKLHNYNLLRIANFMGWKNALAEQGCYCASAIAKAFVKTDASLIEINPLVETSEGMLIALDAKFSIDDNALYRQPQISAFYDPTQQTLAEAEAKKFDLAYVGLEGNIGCMVNGAGLAMATMDIIHLHGGKPSNFLDVGGGASEEKVAAGFKIILADPNVKAILVNIFGGIMDCEILAAGIVSAANDLVVKAPLVVRMEGTNVDKGKLKLANSGLNITIANTLDEAASIVVAAAKKGVKNGNSGK